MPDSARTPLPLADSSAMRPPGLLDTRRRPGRHRRRPGGTDAPWWPLVWSGLWALLPVTLAFWVPVRAREKRRLREDPAAA